MVRSATYRTSKYSAKMVGDVVKNRFDAQHDSMVEQVTNKFADFTKAEEDAKALLNSYGVAVTLVPFYLSFARQCLSIAGKHADEIALDEICIRFDTWVARALNPFYLQQICSAVTGIDIASCTT
jgi:hypothetical protein